jgi:PBSX family phage terminase large subunit
VQVNPLVGKASRAVALSTCRLNIFEGSVRSGKTIASLLRWLQFVLEGPSGNLAMIGKTERTLKRNVIDPLTEMLGKKRCRANWGDGELMLLGRRIYLVGANNETSVSKIQGLTLAGAYGDEITTWPESFWSMLLTRLSIEGARLFGTCNPDNPNHWLMRDYLKRASTWLRHDGTVERRDEPDRLDLARFSFRLADNPSLPAAYVTELAKTFHGLYRLRFIEGLWVLAEGAIYDMFDHAVHVIDQLPVDDGGRLALSGWTLAIDYGTTNPFVALLIGVGYDQDGNQGLYVAREWRWDSRARHRQMTDAEYSTALRKWLDTDVRDELGQVDLERIYVDPSAASFIAQLWRDGWAGVHGADNAVNDGIRSSSSLLGNRRLLVHESCEGTIGEMTGYVWDSDAAEKGEEKPVKVDDHGPDALRYGIMGLRRVWRHWLTIDLAEAA